MKIQNLNHNTCQRIGHIALALILASTCMTAAAAIGAAPASQPSLQLASFLTAKRQAASSSGDAARIAQSRYGGKVVKVSAIETDRGVVYKVKLLLKDGRVKTVTIKGQ